MRTPGAGGGPRETNGRDAETAPEDLPHDDADPGGLVHSYLSRLAPGSFLVLSHGSGDRNDTTGQVTENYRASAPLIARPHHEIARFFDALEMLPPGLTWTFDWKPDSPTGDLPDGRHVLYGGVGTKL